MKFGYPRVGRKVFLHMKKPSVALYLLAAALLCLVFSTSAKADTVTFSEILLPNVSTVTTAYSSFDLTFSNTYYAFDGRFAEDGVGIAEQVNPATIFFTNPVSGLSIDWLTVNTDFVATAYDASNNVLSTFSAGPCGSACSGVANLAGSDISYVIWHDSAGFAAIDSLTFTQEAPAATPEPGTVLLLGVGVLGLAAVKLMKR
jgi:hypothetical protein